MLNPPAQAFLVIPELRAGECMRGYLGRLATANLLPKLFKQEQSGLMAVSRHVRRNAEWSALSPDVLAARVSAVTVPWSSKAYYRLGNSLLSGGMVHLETRQICPTCCGESDTAFCAWELTSYTVCHRHGTKLLTRCDRCSRRLTWRGTSEGSCSCGRAFAEMSTDRGDPYEIFVSHLTARAVERSLAEPSAPDPDNAAPVLGVAQVHLLRQVFQVHVIERICQLCDGFEASAARKRSRDLEMMALLDETYCMSLLQAVQAIAQLDPPTAALKLLPGQTARVVNRNFRDHLDALPPPQQSWLSSIPLHLRARSQGRGRFFQNRTIPEMEKEIQALCAQATAAVPHLHAHQATQ